MPGAAFDGADPDVSAAVDAAIDALGRGRRRPVAVSPGCRGRDDLDDANAAGLVDQPVRGRRRPPERSEPT